MLPPTHGCT